jgi:hypothetical protein
LLVFYHIPKTAGTSSRRGIEVWFPTIVRDLDCLTSPIDASAETGDVCLMGHFAARLVGHELALLDLLPSLKEPNGHTLFTVLRDPLDHAVSAYYHMRDIDKDRLGSLAEFLENGHPFQSSVVLGIADSEYIAPALDSFAVVGDTSDLQKTFDVLADRMGKPRLEVPTVRVGTRDTQVISLNASERSRFERMWPLDFEIYEAARDRLGRSDAGAVQRQFFPHADQTSAFTNAALKRQNEGRKEWAARPDSPNHVAPVLPPEFRLLLDNKDARIQELELKIASVEDRSRSVLERLAQQAEQQLTERNELITILQTAQGKNAELRVSLEKEMQKADRYKQQIKVLRLQSADVTGTASLTSKIATCTGAATEAAARPDTELPVLPMMAAELDAEPKEADASASSPPSDSKDAEHLAPGSSSLPLTPELRASELPKADFVSSINSLKTILSEINSLLTELNAK